MKFSTEYIFTCEDNDNNECLAGKYNTKSQARQASNKQCWKLFRFRLLKQAKHKMVLMVITIACQAKNNGIWGDKHDYANKDGDEVD